MSLFVIKTVVSFFFIFFELNSDKTRNKLDMHLEKGIKKIYRGTGERLPASLSLPVAVALAVDPVWGTELPIPRLSGCTLEPQCQEPPPSPALLAGEAKLDLCINVPTTENLLC